MRKYIGVVLVIISAGLCFAVSLYYITGNHKNIEQEIIITAYGTAGTVSWYTSIPLRHAEGLANALIEGKIDIAGQFSIHTVYEYRVKKGTPIQGIYPEEGIPLVLNAVAILNMADQPEEAKIFLDFLLSERGQYLMDDLNYKYLLRDGVEPLEKIPSLEDLNILLPKNIAEYGKKRSGYIRQFNSFLGSNQ